MKELGERIALVTGSSHGLGKAIAMALAREGAQVIINGRDEKSVLNTMEEISGTYQVQTWSCPVDATDGKAVKEYFEFGPIATLRKLDILVNNVGNLEKFGNFTSLTDEDWLQCYNVTFMSAVRFTRNALPLLEFSGNGRIINISSLPACQPGKFNPHYSAAKSAMNNLTKHLANELGPKNILVNAICPSTLKGGGWGHNIQDRAKRDSISLETAELVMEREEKNKSPIQKMGTLEDVAELVIFLASDKAKFLTGHTYYVDGGIARIY